MIKIAKYKQNLNNKKLNKKVKQTLIYWQKINVFLIEKN